MRPFYDARIADLGPGDLVAVECRRGHTETITASMLTTAGVAPHAKVQDFAPKLHCRECDERGTK